MTYEGPLVNGLLNGRIAVPSDRIAEARSDDSRSKEPTNVSEPVRAVERALDVLECFSAETPRLTLTGIAKRVGMHKSTVHRLLATLEKRGFLRRDAGIGDYQLGLRLLQMTYLTLEHNDLRRLANRFLRQLVDLHRETGDLSVLDEADVIFLDVVECHQRVKLAAAVGQRLPAFATASGKAILAFLPDQRVAQILEHGMPRYTIRTLLTPASFKNDVEDVRRRGFAVSEQEYEEGINAVSAPIFGVDHDPVAAIAIAGPAFRLTPRRMLAIGPDIVAASQSITREFGMTAHEAAH